MANKKYGKRVSQEFNIYFRYVCQDKSVSIRELVRRCNQFFFPSIWRHATKEVEARRIKKCNRDRGGLKGVEVVGGTHPLPFF